jgi:hypothetical protein
LPGIDKLSLAGLSSFVLGFGADTMNCIKRRAFSTAMAGGSLEFVDAGIVKKTAMVG